MADINKIKTITGSTYTIRDAQVPAMPDSTNMFLRGDGTWDTPVNPTTSSGCIFIDGGDCLKVITPA